MEEIMKMDLKKLIKGRSEGKTFKQLGDEFKVSATTIRNYLTSEDADKLRKEMNTEPPKEQNRVGTFTDLKPHGLPSDRLLVYAESIASVCKDKLVVGQRQTTVFLKHPEIRKQVLTFYVSGSKEGFGLFSPFLRKVDKGVQTDTLGYFHKKWKDLPDPTEVANLGVKILKRAKLPMEKA